MSFLQAIPDNEFILIKTIDQSEREKRERGNGINTFGLRYLTCDVKPI